MIFIDSNAVIDLLNTRTHPDRIDWAGGIYERSIGIETLACNLIVVAEVAAGIDGSDSVLDDLARLEIGVLDLSIEAALGAGVAFREYRRRGGPRMTMLPDFLIAAHADVLGAQLMTRDQRIASYFPDLTLITPETDHG